MRGEAFGGDFDDPGDPSGRKGLTEIDRRGLVLRVFDKRVTVRV